MMDQYGNEEDLVNIVQDIISSNSNNSPLNSYDLIDEMTSRGVEQSTSNSSTNGYTSGETDKTAVKETYLEATPPAPTVASSPSVKKDAVKIAGPQYVNFTLDEGDDGDLLKILFFENINGVALLSLVNSKSLQTGNIQYQPILNMAETQNALDPKTLLALQDTLDKYFLQFPINLPRTIPTVGNGPNGTHVYLNLVSGELTIDVVNLGLSENIEIQTLQNGTIYSTNLGNEEF